MSVSKTAVADIHQKRITECRAILAKMKPDDPRRKAVEGNLRAAEAWAKFLADPTTPDLS